MLLLGREVSIHMRTRLIHGCDSISDPPSLLYTLVCRLGDILQAHPLSKYHQEGLIAIK